MRILIIYIYYILAIQETFFTQNLNEILPPACSSMIIITVFRVLVVEFSSEASAPITHSIDCILHVYLVKLHP